MKFIIALSSLILAFALSSVYANSKHSLHSTQWCRDALTILGQIDPLNVELNDLYLTQAGYRHRHFSYNRSKFRESGGTKFPRRITPPGKRIFYFSPHLKAWAAYSPDGKRVGYGRANGGANWCADLGRPCRTPRGSFRVHRKGSYNCKSGKFPRPNGGAAMPYCMFFLGGYAIHGSPGISNYNSSHGCIRVHNQAAYWLSNYFMTIGTRVVVMPY